MQSAEQFSGYSSQLGCGQGLGQPRPLIMPIQLNHCSLTRCKATLLARVEDFPVKKKERKKLGEAGSVSWQFFNFSRNISRIKLRKLIKENHETIISRGKSDFFPFVPPQTSRFFKRTLSSFVSLSFFFFPFFFNLADSLATAKFQRPS